MRSFETAILHYSAPPALGGVEAVMLAHARQFREAGLPLTVIAGRGDAQSLPEGVEFIRIPELDCQHPDVLKTAQELEQGRVPGSFHMLTQAVMQALRPVVSRFDHLIVHNAFSDQSNLPLTAALCALLDEGAIRQAVAWCHDVSWANPAARPSLHEGYPWNLLRSYHQKLDYIAISLQRQKELAEVLGCPVEKIKVIYNGVDPQKILALSSEGAALTARLGLWDADLSLLMPVRIARSKNIEYALELAAELKSLECRVRLIVSGMPSLTDESSLDYFGGLLELRASLGLQEEVRFACQAGPQPGQYYPVSQEMGYELMRASDLIFLPSQEEGFGTPVLEAGLAGIPVVSTAVPAAREIAMENVFVFSLSTEPQRLAEQILTWADEDPRYRLRRQVRQEYTWCAIFRRDLLPLLAR